MIGRASGRERWLVGLKFNPQTHKRLVSRSLTGKLAAYFKKQLVPAVADLQRRVKMKLNYNTNSQKRVLEKGG